MLQLLLEQLLLGLCSYVEAVVGFKLIFYFKILNSRESVLIRISCMLASICNFKDDNASLINFFNDAINFNCILKNFGKICIILISSTVVSAVKELVFIPV